MIDFAGLMNLFQAIAQAKSQQLAQLTPVLKAPQSKIVRRDTRGRRTDLGINHPSGLDLFYANNPQMRRGEFDPTGRKGNRRRALGYARQDANDSMAFRNDQAEGLARLAATFQDFQKNNAPDADGIRPFFPADQPAFAPLYR